jgi:hypothetical protein
VTARLIFVAVTHQRDVSMPPELLNQPQSELLAVILDVLVAFVEANAALKEFTPIAAREICPTLTTGPEQLFAWPKVCHPLVIAGLFKASTAN